MHVLIDDFRDLPGMDIICRTADAGIALLTAMPVTNLYIDHDLGCTLNGYQVVVVLLRNNKCPRNIQIVSDNSVGVQNITRALINAGYVVTLDGRNFFKPDQTLDNF